MGSGSIVQPNVDDLVAIIAADKDRYETKDRPNMYPVYSYFSAEYLTPHLAYLKLTRPGDKNAAKSPSFLFESAKNGDQIDRYSFMGTRPRKILTTGPLHGKEEDPLVSLEQELKNTKQAQLPGIPKLSGGAIGYVSYDCIKYFEPRTKRDLKDVLELPEAALMLFDLIVAFDNVYQRFQVINNITIDDNDTEDDIRKKYVAAHEQIKEVKEILTAPEDPLIYPEQPEIVQGQTFTSNVGQDGYEGFVTKLKKHILKGDIIQAVPSQRVARPTSLHPFNIYRHLRTVNPSPYMFYIDYLDFQIVGASPELLVKSDLKDRIVTHPIAGTIRRGKTREEDDELAHTLQSSLKDRAEHVMLVDLARNDVNRVCAPDSTNVDRLLTVERFSHVMHLVSQVSGVLRGDKTRFDAFRSIFPAGTVSGAPKVRAMELIGELEQQKRGVYAGAVGHWSYDGKTMDTCIALRTMVVKQGVAYLQAGGGIVYDSDPYDEYIETMNKMKANNNTIVEAEKIWVEKRHRADYEVLRNRFEFLVTKTEPKYQSQLEVTLKNLHELIGRLEPKIQTMNADQRRRFDEIRTLDFTRPKPRSIPTDSKSSCSRDAHDGKDAGHRRDAQQHPRLPPVALVPVFEELFELGLNLGEHKTPCKNVRQTCHRNQLGHEPLVCNRVCVHCSTVHSQHGLGILPVGFAKIAELGKQTHIVEDGDGNTDDSELTETFQMTTGRLDPADKQNQTGEAHAFGAHDLETFDGTDDNGCCGQYHGYHLKKNDSFSKDLSTKQLRDVCKRLDRELGRVKQQKQPPDNASCYQAHTGESQRGKTQAHVEQGEKNIVLESGSHEFGHWLVVANHHTCSGVETLDHLGVLLDEVAPDVEPVRNNVGQRDHRQSRRERRNGRHVRHSRCKHKNHDPNSHNAGAPEELALFGVEGQVFNYLVKIIFVSDLGRDVAVQNGLDSTNKNTNESKTLHCLDVGDAKHGWGVGKLSLLGVDIVTVNQVAAQNSHLRSKHGFPEIPGSAHLRQDFWEHHRSRKDVRDVGDSNQLVHQRLRDKVGGHHRGGIQTQQVFSVLPVWLTVESQLHSKANVVDDRDSQTKLTQVAQRPDMADDASHSAKENQKTRPAVSLILQNNSGLERTDTAVGCRQNHGD
ncbi:hypothetical protein OGAPHI_003151 [Ogataea philodendri]|uniref:anthranilate synthase n=1 Tax=Ogataea philodendri TaxID=1378263 RepID=A0A9P8P8V0_9ASCO|nr:uncharacterized protein OGAPHI_003151 [Ogataea philodendri]KAH3667502.1 hypothetical protein OGAPHI_003151 [Ogataea philodendri]